MKGLFLLESRRFEIREVPMPVIRDHEVLVKIAYCGICTLEQRLYEGERKIYYPIVPGHEASATVVSVGTEVMTNVSPGDHVVLDLVNRCHACPACLSGNSNLCENRFKKGQKVLGAFAEYMVVRPDQIHVIPEDLPLDQAAFTEPLACCIRSLKKVDLCLGDTILIVGAGTMGLLHAKVALAMGARVFVSDICKERLEDAKRMGVDGVFDASDTADFVTQVKRHTQQRGVDCCIITTPSHTAAKAGVQILASGGKLNIYTSYTESPPLPLDMNSIHRNEFILTGTEGRSEFDFHTAVKALANKKITVDDLISGIFPMERIEEAMKQALSGLHYRILIHMGG